MIKDGEGSGVDGGEDEFSDSMPVRDVMSFEGAIVEIDDKLPDRFGSGKSGAVDDKHSTLCPLNFGVDGEVESERGDQLNAGGDFCDLPLVDRTGQLLAGFGNVKSKNVPADVFCCWERGAGIDSFHPDV